MTKEHYNTGIDNPTNDNHKTATIRPGTTTAGTTPLKLTSGPLMMASETGAIEFLFDRLYFTQMSGVTRKTFAIYDDAFGTKVIYNYRDTGDSFTRLGIDSDSQVLTASSVLPIWQNLSGVINNIDGGAARTYWCIDNLSTDVTTEGNTSSTLPGPERI